jgi:hypothetical protein
VVLTAHPLLAPRSGKSRAISLPPLWAFRPVTGYLYLLHKKMKVSEPNCDKHSINLTCPEFFCEHSLLSLLLIPNILILSFLQWSVLHGSHYVMLHKLSISTDLLLVSLLFGACLHCHNVQTPYNGTSACVISFDISVSQKC